jgi:hypothetical protein
VALFSAAHIKTLETKCVTLIEHYKKVQGERKELLDKFNSASLAAEEAQERLATLPDLQNLCRSLEEKARRAEDERNAAILAGEAKQKLLEAAQASGGGSSEAVTRLQEENARLVGEVKRSLEALSSKGEELAQEQKAKASALQMIVQVKEENARLVGDLAQVGVLKAENVRLSGELKHHVELVRVRTEELAREQKQVTAASQAVVQAKEESARLVAEVAQIKAGSVQAKDENVRLVNEVKRTTELLRAKSDELAREQHANKATVLELKEENGRLASEIKQFKLEQQAKPVSGLDEGEASLLRQQLSDALDQVAAQKGDLAALVKKSDSNSSHLAAELSALQSKNDRLEAELALAQNAKDSIAEMLSHFKEENARLLNDLAQSKANCAAMEASGSKEAAQLRDRLSTVESALAESKKQLAEMSNIAFATKSEMAALQSKNQGLEAELALAHNAKGSSSEMLNHFKEENSRLVAEVQRSAELLRVQSEEHVRALALQQQKAREDGERALGALEQATQSELGMLRKERGTYGQLMAARDAKVAQLQQVLEESERVAAERAAATEGELRAEVARKQEELEFAEESRRDLVAQAARLREAAAGLEASRARAEGELASASAALEEARNAVRAQEQRAIRAEDEAAAQRRVALASQAQATEAAAALERLQQETAATANNSAAAAAANSKPVQGADDGPSIAEEESKKLKVLLRMAKQHLQDYREKFASCSQELRVEREARQREGAAASEGARRLDEAERALERNRNEAAALREAVASAEGRCAALQREAAEAAERYAALRAKAAALAAAAGAGGTAGAGVEAAAERAEIRALRQELVDLRAAAVELGKHSAALGAAQSDAGRARAEAAAAREEAGKLRKALEEASARAREEVAVREREAHEARAALQKELDARTAQLAQLEQETGAKFDELSAHLKLYRQRTKKTLEQKDLLLVQLKKRLKDAGRDEGTDSDNLTSSSGGNTATTGGGTVVAAAAAGPASGPAVAASSGLVDVASGLGAEDAREKMAQLSGVARDNARLIQAYQQRIAELERGKQGGDANIAYLKNVLLRWFENPTSENSKRLTPVLKVLLGLTDDEVKIIDSNKKGWFF